MQERVKDMNSPRRTETIRGSWIPWMSTDNQRQTKIVKIAHGNCQMSKKSPHNGLLRRKSIKCQTTIFLDNL